MYKEMRCAAVIVAGGSGSRFGGDKPKQFLELGGLPVLGHSLRAFEHAASVDELLIVAGTEYIGLCRDIARGMGLTKLRDVIAGGDCRQASVFSAVKRLGDEGFDGLVLVHDAARPFVDAGAVDAVLAAAYVHGAATLGTMLTDTVKLTEGGKVLETLPRERLFAVQTPQAFRADALFKAHRDAQCGAGYDDCQLLEKIGISPRVVAGSPLNIKITHEIDMILAKHIIKGM